MNYSVPDPANAKSKLWLDVADPDLKVDLFDYEESVKSSLDDWPD